MRSDAGRIIACVTPTWVVLVVGFGSGLAGTLISTVLRISHERGAEIRSRMLEAADDLAVSLIAALVAVDDALEPARVALADNGQLDPEFGEQATYSQAIGRVERAYEATHAHVVRVWLLFGDDTAAGEAARRTDVMLANALTGLKLVEIGRTDELLRRAQQEFRTFLREAMRQLRRGAFRQPVDGLRRRDSK